jgi:outer membrane protein TolC
MKRIIITITLFLGCMTASSAQEGTDLVLRSIENNNGTLKALRESAAAQKLENRSGIYLPDPEIGFNYLWGSPGEIGSRTDVSIVQSFDFATVSGIKSRLSGARNELIDWQYKEERMNILLEARKYCIELVYYNSLQKEMDSRLKNARELAEAYKVRLDKGDANILEYNKIIINFSAVEGEMKRVETERKVILEQLKRLNGGTELALDGFSYQADNLPPDFETWFAEAAAKSPVLAYVRQESEVSKRELSLEKAGLLPKLSAGYMSEKVVGQQYQGLSVGLSVPLWSGSTRVKQARATLRASEARESDARVQFYGRLRSSFERVYGLKVAAETYRRALESAGNRDLLKRALDAGEISVLDYIMENSFYYNTVNQALEAERDYRLALAELTSVEL